MAQQSQMDFLSGVQMTQVAQAEAIKPGIPTVVPPAFFKPSPSKPAGMEVQWDEVTGTRQTAMLVHSTSPSVRREIPGVIRRTATALGTKQNYVLDQQFLLALKSDLPIVATRARELLTINMRNFSQYAMNLKISTVCSMLSLGAINYDRDGNLLPNSTGALNPVSYNVPTGNVVTHGGYIGATAGGTDLAIDATDNTKVTSASHNFVTADLGSVIKIYSGTGFTVGNYQILRVASNAAFLSSSPGTTSSTGGVWEEGLTQVGPIVPDFASASADIPTFFRQLRTYNVRQNNYNLANVLYGQNVPGYLGTTNTSMQAYFSRNQNVNGKILMDNQIPVGLFGYNWTPVSDAYFVDNTGTSGMIQPWFDDNSIYVFPDITSDWYEMYEGGTLVPTGIGTPNMSLETMINLSMVANGAFSYMEMGSDPIAVKQIVGDYWFPTMKVPGVYYRIKVAG